MANKNYRRSRGAAVSGSPGGAAKFIAVLIGVAIMAAVVCGCGYASREEGKWFRQSDITKWHLWSGGKAPAETEQPPDVAADGNTTDIDGDGGIIANTSDGKAMKSGGIYAMPDGMTYDGADAEYISDGELTLYAFLTNEYINAQYDWAVTFSDPSSDWAEGKSVAEYLEVTPTYAGSAYANVRFVQGFSEPIIITVTLRAGVGTEMSVTCRVDCMKQAFVDRDSLYVNCDFGESLTLEIGFDYCGEGTVPPRGNDFRIQEYELSLTDWFKASVQRRLNFDVAFKSMIKPDGAWVSLDFTEDTLCVDFGDMDYGLFIEGWECYDAEHREAIIYAWYQAYVSDSALPSYFNLESEIAIRSTNNFERLSVWNGGNISGSNYGTEIAATVQLNKSGVIFGAGV